MMPTWVYAKSPDSIYVNLFVGSTIKLENVAGTDVEMVQATDYPWSGKLALTVNPAMPKAFSLKIRVPNREVSSLYRSTPNSDGITSVTVNGKKVQPVIDKGYATITRDWKAGDKVDVQLPMKVQRVHASEKIPAIHGKVALRYGPLIYNIEQVDESIAKPLSPDSPLTVEWRADLLGGVMVIKGKFADGSPMVAIPNYARTNRDKEMPLEGSLPLSADGAVRPARRPPTSIVWIREA